LDADPFSGPTVYLLAYHRKVGSKSKNRMAVTPR